MKMTRRSPDERLRKAADCLSRLRGLRPDPMIILHGRYDLWEQSPPSFEDGTGPGLEPVGGEFQTQFETGYPGGGAHLIFALNLR